MGRRWTNHQARSVISDKYYRVRNRKAKAGAASFADFLKLVLFLLALPFILVALPIIGMVMLVRYIRGRSKKPPTEPPPYAHGAYSSQPQVPPPTMTGHDFEHHCANILRCNGYTNVQVTKASGDNGVDIVAVRDGIRHAIQTKYYTGTVGNDAVQQVHAGRAMYQCAVGIVMTNSTFTKSATETAARLGIVLWDGNMLNTMAAKAKAAQQPQPPPPYQPSGQASYWAAPQPAPPPRPETYTDMPPPPYPYQNQSPP